MAVSWKLLLRALAMVMALVPGGAARADVVLVEDGQARATVVLPRGASAGHQFAADELVQHIMLSTDVELPVVEEGADYAGLPIFVGDTGAAQKRVTDGEVGKGWSDLPADSFEVYIGRDRLILHGRNPLANLYSVYDFLEQEVGVRWLTPAENGTIVPRRKSLVLRQTRRIRRPAFKLRMFFVRDQTAQWALRNRVNGLFPADWAEKVDGDLAYLPPGIGAGIHSFADLIPPKEYFADHPEYFPLIGGKRHPISIHRGQLCTTNPDVIRIVADKVRAYFEQRPRARVFPVAPDDDAGWCECEHCRRVDQELGGGRMWTEYPSVPVTTDRLMPFLNQVAQAALGDQPDKTLITLAYINYLPPPHSVQVDPRVLPLLCHYAPACYAHRMNDPSCAANARFADSLRGWVPLCPNAGVYAYTDKSMWYYFWRPVFRLMPHDIRFLHEQGIHNYLAQSNGARWAYMGPLYWVTTRMLWDPSQDIDGLISEWCHTLFGPAGDAMLKHYNTLEQAVLATGHHYRDNPLSQAVGLYDMKLIAQAEAALSEAEKLAAGDKACRERVSAVRSRWTISRTCYDYLAAYRHYEETGKLEDLSKSVEALQELQRHVGKGWKPYSCPSAEDLARELATGGIRWSGFGPEETKGGRQCRNSDSTGPGDGRAGWATFRFFLPDATKDTRLTMVVWGRSAGFSPVICTKGHGAGYNAGGVWNTFGTFKPSGKEEWQEVAFTIPAKFYEPDVRRQIVGFGGGDSQIWIADVRVEAVNEK